MRARATIVIGAIVALAAVAIGVASWRARHREPGALVARSNPQGTPWDSAPDKAPPPQGNQIPAWQVRQPPPPVLLPPQVEEPPNPAAAPPPKINPKGVNAADRPARPVPGLGTPAR